MRRAEWSAFNTASPNDQIPTIHELKGYQTNFTSGNGATAYWPIQRCGCCAISTVFYVLPLPPLAFARLVRSYLPELAALGRRSHKIGYHLTPESSRCYIAEVLSCRGRLGFRGAQRTSMSIQVSRRRLMAPDIYARKGGEPIVALTSYHAHTAAIADAHCDFLLVGDSLGMVMHGFETTVPVPLDLMIMHARAVVRGSKKALVVVDMPFGTYEESPPVAFRNAARVMKETDCGAVKLEGGQRMAETIRYLVDRGIPVMAHIGLTPQSIHVLGGFKTQGRNVDQWADIENDARVVSDAGAFAVVLEAMAAPLAERITKAIPVPTIGIGASPGCDGQILVMEDMLGLSPRVPKFVKEFGAIGKAIDRAIGLYAAEVRARSFPAPEHTYSVKGSGAVKGAGQGEFEGANPTRATKKPRTPTT